MLKWAGGTRIVPGWGLPLYAAFFDSSHHCTICVFLLGPWSVRGRPVGLPIPASQPAVRTNITRNAALPCAGAALLSRRLTFPFVKTGYRSVHALIFERCTGWKLPVGQIGNIW